MFSWQLINLCHTLAPRTQKQFCGSVNKPCSPKLSCLETFLGVVSGVQVGGAWCWWQIEWDEWLEEIRPVRDLHWAVSMPTGCAFLGGMFDWQPAVAMYLCACFRHCLPLISSISESDYIDWWYSLKSSISQTRRMLLIAETIYSFIFVRVKNGNSYPVFWDSMCGHGRVVG